MWWIFAAVLQVIIIISGIRNEERAGHWSWSKFCFALGFAALECFIVIAPIVWIHDLRSPYFWPVYATAWVIAALNFIWMIIVARRWKLPDGRTSLEADRDRR